MENGEVILGFKRRGGDWYKGGNRQRHTKARVRIHLNELADKDDRLGGFPNPTWKEAENTTQLAIVGPLPGPSAIPIYLNYRFTTHLSTELKYTQAFGDFSSTKMASLASAAPPLSQWRLSPF